MIPFKFPKLIQIRLFLSIFLVLTFSEKLHTYNTILELFGIAGYIIAFAFIWSSLFGRVLKNKTFVGILKISITLLLGLSLYNILIGINMNTFKIVENLFELNIIALILLSIYSIWSTSLKDLA